MDDLERPLRAEAQTAYPVYPSRPFFKRFWQTSRQQWQERSQGTLFPSALIISQGLTYLVTENPDWPEPVTLNLSVAIYIANLYVFFTAFNYLVHFITGRLLDVGTRPHFFAEFTKFFLTLLSAGQYQYYFIYEPIFGYARPKSLSIVIVTTALYSAVAAAIYYRFRQIKDIALKSKVAQAEAQYSLLESQMQPHFLFNSLNVLSELIYVDPDLANSMTQKLADLYREILHNSKSKFSTLESEISILQKYVEIQKIRFGDRIAFEVEVSPAFHNIQIPSLMLQTLVENAIKHGISPKKEGGLIKLQVQKKGHLFEVTIANTGAPFRGQKGGSGSTGLQNTRNRLELAYGKASDFRIYAQDGTTFVKFNITGRTK
jgi:signal transduction histidine kinase